MTRPKRKSRPAQQLEATVPPGRRLHVAFLVRSFGFPHGMAASNRVQLLGRSLVEQNADVTVLCTRVSELPGSVRNANVRGKFAGISYEYTCGSTVRPDSFAARRYREARGYVAVLLRLARMQRAGRLDCAYLWSGARSWRPAPWLLVTFLKILKVPVIVELNERPWATSALPRAVSRHLSLLDGISGAVAISGELTEWAAHESGRIGRAVRILELPIVVDVHEQTPMECGPGDKVLVYAASPGYVAAALAFILAAMRHVWRRHPDCRLVVTGVDAEAVGGGGSMGPSRPPWTSGSTRRLRRPRQAVGALCAVEGASDPPVRRRAIAGEIPEQDR